MSFSIRVPFRRKLLAALAAVALVASASAPAAMRAEPTPVPAAHYRNFYSSSSYITQVGRGMWTCQGTYVQIWGTTSLYYKVTPIVCSGGPGPLEP